MFRYFFGAFSFRHFMEKPFMKKQADKDSPKFDILLLGFHLPCRLVHQGA